ncbi:MAG: DEAD/DEAH box helicase, partial [Anaerolineales bacterium]|nr:DEAD/DEAH box helicase [Anaerolineales bacterium]
MSLDNLLSLWGADPEIRGSIVAWEKTPARLPQLEPLPTSLRPELSRALQHTGIRSLYRHQVLAWRHAQEGRHVILVTGTASGKTLAYNLPVLNRLIDDPDARALYLFPTKALAQDQVSTLETLTAQLPAGITIPAGTYDGDTTARARQAIRKNGRIIVTNPDMLHLGILPHHPTWSQFFRHLTYIVIDESHAYRGVFGSHVANVLRRLNRILEFYRAAPRYFLTSATIGNPIELAEQLTGQSFQLVDEDGSARGPQNFLIYNPPLVNEELFWGDAGIGMSIFGTSLAVAGIYGSGT